MPLPGFDLSPLSVVLMISETPVPPYQIPSPESALPNVVDFPRNASKIRSNAHSSTVIVISREKPLQLGER